MTYMYVKSNGHVIQVEIQHGGLAEVCTLWVLFTGINSVNSGRIVNLLSLVYRKVV